MTLTRSLERQLLEHRTACAILSFEIRHDAKRIASLPDNYGRIVEWAKHKRKMQKAYTYRPPRKAPDPYLECAIYSTETSDPYIYRVQKAPGQFDHCPVCHDFFFSHTLRLAPFVGLLCPEQKEWVRKAGNWSRPWSGKLEQLPTAKICPKCGAEHYRETAECGKWHHDE